MRTWLFLTPGASRTAYAVGVLDVLIREARLRFDVIGASSVGALNGAFAAMDDIETLLEVWRNWETSDVMRVDWAGILRGGLLWAPSLMTNEPEHASAIDPYVRESRLRPGVTLRFNVANLTTGRSEILEYPGAAMPLERGVGASVAVPVAFAPSRWNDMQLADGLTTDGFPLEETVLGANVDRVFVVGIAPLAALGPCRNAYQAALRASDWNQYYEVFHGLEEVAESDREIATWYSERAAAVEAITEVVPDGDLRASLLAELDSAYEGAGFPYGRGVVEIIPILPAEDVRASVMRFDPKRSRDLIELGRADARKVLARLEP
jgi:predicted acylesterase/phospholipase RssA